MLINALAMIPALVFAIVLHEIAHGWAALALGDPTAKERKRLSLNPIRHVDPLGTVILPAGLALAGMPVFGWAKPVPVNARRLRNPRFGMMAVAAAGPGSNFLLAGLGAIVLGLAAGQLAAPPVGFVAYLLLSLQYFIIYNIFLALFNLLPIPPFDGSHIVEGLLPERALPAWRKLKPLGLPLVFVVLVIAPYLFDSASPVGFLLIPPAEWLMGHYLALSDWIAGFWLHP